MLLSNFPMPCWPHCKIHLRQDIKKRRPNKKTHSTQLPKFTHSTIEVYTVLCRGEYFFCSEDGKPLKWNDILDLLEPCLLHTSFTHIQSHLIVSAKDELPKNPWRVFPFKIWSTGAIGHKKAVHSKLMRDQTWFKWNHLKSILALKIPEKSGLQNVSCLYPIT